MGPFVVGRSVGLNDGFTEGFWDGVGVGFREVGPIVGFMEGLAVGLAVGLEVVIATVATSFACTTLFFGDWSTIAVTRIDSIFKREVTIIGEAWLSCTDTSRLIDIRMK